MPAAFHQIVAVVYVLRRLVIGISVMPALGIGGPIAMRLAYGILSLAVRGDDRSVPLVVALTAFFSGTSLYFLSIMNSVSNETAVVALSKPNDSQPLNGTKEGSIIEVPEVRPAAFQSTQSFIRIGIPLHRRIWIRLWCITFVLSVWLVRTFERSFPFRLLRSLLPTHYFLLPSFSSSLRLSLSMLVLGWMVGARFSGPTSIVRFSAVPLISNPWDVSVQRFLQNVWNSVLVDLRGSDPVPAPHAHPKPPLVEVESLVGRRFQRPTVYSTAQHIVLALAASYIVAYIAVFPLSTVTAELPEHERLFRRSVHLTACFLTMLGSLLSVLDGVSHEINPYVLLEPTSHNWFERLCRTLLRSVIYTALVVPILSILVTMLVLPNSDKPMSYAGVTQMYGELTRNCILIAFYVTGMDEALRTSLLHPRPNLTKIANELSDETPEVTLLAVMLHSLLGDPTLVQQVVHSSVPTGMSGPERDELKRSEQLTKKMARVYLTPSKESMSEAPLEEDILRILLLELLGGGGGGGHPSSIVSERHQRMIHAWIDRPVPRRQPTTAKLHEPLSCLLVRGLCTYIGGAGEALTLCAQSSETTWHLSPSLFCCLELALEAIRRCLVCSLAPDGRTLCDWKCSHLSIQVPSALTALHQLRCGMVRYSIATTRSRTDSIGNHPMNKPYTQLIQHCDRVALSILQSMKSLKGLGRVDLAIADRECLEWKALLLARAS